MTDETVVAIYETTANAQLAIAEIKAAGIADDAISVHGGPRATSTPAPTPAGQQGFWANLFGGEPDHETAIYDRSVERGATVVTVRTTAAQVARIVDILDSHDPVNVDERMTGSSPKAPPASQADDTVQLAQESLSVGKRVVNRGGTRIRRFVVETPVEQNVTLHAEKVTLERRPVANGSAYAPADFKEKTIEMMESAEEAVVSKTARVYEEVGLRKEATDRVETVRDTVRKDEVEIEQIPANGARRDLRAPKI